MGFEAKVMQIVKEEVGQGDEFLSGFAYGTLFVDAFPDEAKRLLKRLKKEFAGKVQMTATASGEFAYDFTA